MSTFEEYVIPNYGRVPIVMVKGKGSLLWDAEGKEYLDLFPGWAVDGLGHCHPTVSKAIKEQAEVLLHVPNTYYHPWQGELARLIAENSFGGQCFFCNSGAEAVEAAIKIARLHAGEGRFKIITMENSFHGRTMGALAATAQPKYHKGLEPMLEGFTYVPFDDLKAVETAIDDQTCAVMVEPIQGEGGINVGSAEYLSGLRTLCDKKKLLLIFDEIQTGMGRTGKFFAYQHCGVEPDVMTLAKSLGGGLAIGAIEARREVAASLVPGTHASTFGGNPMACSAAIAVFRAIAEENLLENAQAMGQYLTGRLRELQDEFDIIESVRGIGLMIGVPLTIPGADLVAKCMSRGVLLNCTHDTVIRFMPAITVSQEEIDRGLDIFVEVLRECCQ